MNGIEEEMEVKKDHSRPFFPRKIGEMGLYMDVDEAALIDTHAYGSDHLKRVDLNEKLGEQLAKRDLVKVKGELERRGHFRGVVLEELRRVTPVLPVLFDTMEALQDLWKLHEGKQLSSLFQSILVDKAMLEALGVRKMTLRVRMWPDEEEACREEMAKILKEKKRVDINSRPRDVALIHQVQKFQKDKLSQLREQLQDDVSRFDETLSDFLLEIKRALPQKHTRMANLKEFQTNMTVAMGMDPKGTTHVKNYFSTLERLRNWLAQAEVNLCLPLTLVSTRSENDKQRELKKVMKDGCVEMQKLLRPAVALGDIPSVKEWESKVTAREKTLFMAIISLPPLGLERVIDVDQSLDEYISQFPSLSA